MKNKPVCYDVSYAHPEVFSGVPSFLGLPVVRRKEDLHGHDFVIMGAPWEGVCTYGGATFVENATKTIRTCSARYGGYLPELDFDLFDHFSGADYGDAAVKSGDTDFTFQSVGKHLGDIVDAGGIPIVFGGDHSLSYPLIKRFAEKYDGNIGIVHFDAHMDNMEHYGEELYARCSPFYRLYGVSGFNPKNLVSLGIRGPRNHFGAVKEAKKHGASVITSFEIKEEGPKKSIKKALEIAAQGTKALYVSVCSDALDIAHNPGGPADPCGLSTYELAVMLHECGLAGARGFDYMEIYPPKDLHNQSSHVACWMALYIMNGMAQCMLKQKPAA
ncbi:MAG: agmatinase family protein [Treponema sp.]|nr:agmatinase family protein [Treponema sp.]